MTDSTMTPTIDNPTTAELHRQQEARLAEIEQQVKAEQPLTSDRKALSCLHAVYQDNNAPFVAGLVALEQTYSNIRLVRGDGNCFYRAFLYSLAEQLLPVDDAAHQRRLEFLKDPLESNWNRIITTDGYDELTLEIFYETTRDFIMNLTTPQVLHDDLSQENAVSDYATWFLRLVTAAHLKQQAERFVPFIAMMGDGDDGGSIQSLGNTHAASTGGGGGGDSSSNNKNSYSDMMMQQFCATQVEPMGKECEDVQIMALAEAMQCRVCIEYLDGHGQGNQVTRHVFGPQDGDDNKCLWTIHLLYRPGHYDILYPRQDTASS